MTITVNDLSGKLVKKVSEAYFAAGHHTVQFYRQNQKKGLYFYTIKTESGSESGLMSIE